MPVSSDRLYAGHLTLLLSSYPRLFPTITIGPMVSPSTFHSSPAGRFSWMPPFFPFPPLQALSSVCVKAFQRCACRGGLGFWPVTFLYMGHELLLFLQHLFMPKWNQEVLKASDLSRWPSSAGNGEEALWGLQVYLAEDIRSQSHGDYKASWTDQGHNWRSDQMTSRSPLQP